MHNLLKNIYGTALYSRALLTTGTVLCEPQLCEASTLHLWVSLVFARLCRQEERSRNTHDCCIRAPARALLSCDAIISLLAVSNRVRGCVGSRYNLRHDSGQHHRDAPDGETHKLGAVKLSRS